MIPPDREPVAATAAWLDVEPTFERWLAGDLEGVRTNLDEQAARLASRGPVEQRFAAQHLVTFNLALGRLAEAESGNAQAWAHELFAAEAMRRRGRREDVRRYVRQRLETGSSRAVFAHVLRRCWRTSASSTRPRP